MGLMSHREPLLVKIHMAIYRLGATRAMDALRTANPPLAQRIQAMSLRTANPPLAQRIQAMSGTGW